MKSTTVVLLPLAVLLRLCSGQSHETSPYDFMINSYLASCSHGTAEAITNDAALTNITLAQDAAERVVAAPPTGATWSPAWIVDETGTILAAVEADAPQAAITLSWANVSWTSEPEEIEVWALSGCTLARSSARYLTWRGTIQRWKAERGQYNMADVPSDLRSPAGTTPFRPAVTVDWPARTLDVSSLLTSNASGGVSIVSYVYLLNEQGVIFGLWHTDGLGASAATVEEGSGDFAGGLSFSASHVALPPHIQSLSACAAVVYDSECVGVSLLGYLVADIESGRTAAPLDAASQTVLSVTSPSHTILTTSLLVHPSCASSAAATVVYARDATTGGGGEVLAYKASGDLAFATTASMLDVYILCGSTLSKLGVDVTPLRVALTSRGCTLDGTTYSPGAVMYVNASTGANCTCSYGSAYCGAVAGELDTEGMGPSLTATIPLWIWLALIGGLLVLCACITLCVWRTNRLRAEQDRLSAEDGTTVNTKRLNIEVLRESVATGMVFELPGEDRRATLTSSRMSMSERSKTLVSGRFASGKLPTVASADVVAADAQSAEAAESQADPTAGVELTAK